MRLLLGLTVFILTASCGGGSHGGAAPTPPSSSAPAITVQPSDQSVSVGQTATFTVTAASGTPMTYQWQRNASPIAGATAQSYTTAVTTLGDSGSRFAGTRVNASFA